jgi:uncharacterized protein YciI
VCGRQTQHNHLEQEEILKSSWLLALVLPLLGTPAYAQVKPEYDMGVMQMVLLVRSAARVSPDDSLLAMRLQSAYVDTLLSRGEVAFSGIAAAPDDTLREILVLKSDSLEVARRFSRELPTVQVGLYEARFLSWYAARNYLRPASKPLTRTEYMFGILVRGPKSTGEVTEETKKIQAAHLANINRLSKTGKLVLAGPFQDEGRERGVFIFKVPTLKEAQALTNTDPAVKAGRLVIELHRMAVPRGVLP